MPWTQSEANTLAVALRDESARCKELKDQLTASQERETKLREDLQRFYDAAAKVISEGRQGYDIDALGDAMADAEITLGL